MVANRRCAQRREGRGTSFGKTLHPAGTVMVSLAATVNHSVTWAMLSQYSRADDLGGVVGATGRPLGVADRRFSRVRARPVERWL